MLKLPFVNQFEQIKTTNVNNEKTTTLLEIFRLINLFNKHILLFHKQTKTLLKLCIKKVVEVVIAITNGSEMCLLNLYNFLTCFKVETLGAHRGSGRIERLVLQVAT